MQLYLSPDDSNSMSSPAQVAHRVLEQGWTSLSGVPIREWEFLNYYSFGYDAAPAGALALTTELVAGETEGSYSMQIGIASEAMTQAQRSPMNVALVLPGRTYLGVRYLTSC